MKGRAIATAVGAGAEGGQEEALRHAEAELEKEELARDRDVARLQGQRAEVLHMLEGLNALLAQAREAGEPDDELERRAKEATVPALGVEALTARSLAARQAAIEARREASTVVRRHLDEVGASLSTLAAAVARDEKVAARLARRAQASAQKRARLEARAVEHAPPEPPAEVPTPLTTVPLARLALVHAGGPGRGHRISPRVKMQAAVDLSSDSNFFTGFSSDISDGGLFVATVNFLTIGTRVDVTFTLPSGEQVEAHGEVRWIREVDDKHPDSFPGMGIQFVDLAEPAREAIVRFVESREPLFFPG